MIQRDAESKVVDYRDVYDGALVRAQQMAAAIGGWRGYAGFDGFGLESYAQGALDHQIGNRPVFAKDPLDDLELEEARLANLKAAVEAGIPLATYMRANGYEEEFVAAVVASPEYQAKLRSMRAFADAGEQGG